MKNVSPRHNRAPFRYSPPKNMTQVLSSVPLLTALMLGGVGYGIMEIAAPDAVFMGLCGGTVIGMVAGLIGVWWYIHRKPEPPSELHPSEEGTATDPDLYNVAD